MLYYVYHLIQSCYNFIPHTFASLRCPAKKLYIIHSQILDRVVKCGLDILEIFENPYDLPQPLIIHSCPIGQIFIFFYIMLKGEICECCIGKDVEGSVCGLFYGTIQAFASNV
jgi:hypothetical protein